MKRPARMLVSLAAMLCAAVSQPAPAQTPLGGVVSVSGGSLHTCAVMGDGGVKCWGYNVYGMLGDGTQVDRLNPVDVQGAAGVTSVKAGYLNTCVLTGAGSVLCWGLNDQGQVGDGSGQFRLTPTYVSGLTSGVSAIAVGNYHACALTYGGAVKCWGGNANGQIGDGTFDTRTTPVDVTGLSSGVTAISAGREHTCALTSAGGVKCWGSGSGGALGDGAATTRTTPVDVSGLSSGVSAISAGSAHTCARMSATAGLKCWGNNGNGQLGDGTTEQRNVPTDVPSLASGVGIVASGGDHTCVSMAAGGVKCWGANASGEVGDGTYNQRLSPVDVAGLAGSATRLSSGWNHVCVITTVAGLQCWGANRYGQLGDGTSPVRKTPVSVQGLESGVATASAGGDRTCALTSSGTAKCWGYNLSGQLGDGTVLHRISPTDVTGVGSGAQSISARGATHACAVTAAGGVKCWGSNTYGQLGNGTTTDSIAPVDVTGISGATAVAVGGMHSCAIVAGGVKCWGGNGAYQLAWPDQGYQAVPVSATGLGSGVVAISAGYAHTCAILTGGALQCWGDNYFGQVGDGSTTTRSAPVNVTGLGSGVLAVAAGNYYTCAIAAGGGLKCWGYNGSGQFGTGNTADSAVPVDVPGLTSGVASLATTADGSYRTCAVTTAGALKCWGINWYGALGDGSTTDRLAPVAVVGFESGGAAAVTTGTQHTCALTTGGGLKCWGYNQWGQVGDGTAYGRAYPASVISVAMAPGPPTITGVTPGDGRLTVTFTTPSNGGSPITGYTVTCNPGNRVGVGVASPVTVWGLINGQTYYCTVTATNAIGTGEASALSGGFTVAPAKTIAISSSLSHTLALDASGKVYAWGSDSHGQLGQGRAINRLAPARVQGLPTIDHLSLSTHALAVDSLRQVWSWGDNACGQLGPRDGTSATRVSRAVGAIGMTRVAAGGCFSLALKADGTVWGWGNVPGYGSAPGLRKLAGLEGIVEISAGTSHALARRGDGAVFAFGDNAAGQLGLGTTGAAQAATQVPGIAATAIAAGDVSSMILLADGTVQFWGRHADGTQKNAPFLLPAVGGKAVSLSVKANLPHVAGQDGALYTYAAQANAWTTLTRYTAIGNMTQVIAGAQGFDFGIGAAGQLYGSGSNMAGQLAQGDIYPRTNVVAVPGMIGVAQVATGSSSPAVLARKTDGTVWFWGADTLGESGDGTAIGSSVPLPVNIPATIKAIATGERFSVALDTTGAVWGWGDGRDGAFGALQASVSTPAVIPGVSTSRQIAAGGPGTIVALSTSGSVQVSGPLSFSGDYNPTFVPGLLDIVAVATGGGSAYALANDGKLYAWGDNAQGQLGNGSTTSSTTPVQVQGIAGAIARIRAGATRASAVTSDGKVWSWGAAPLGNGTASGSTTAVMATSINDADDVSVGSASTLVLSRGGGVFAWGSTGLAEAAGKDVLTPFTVTFHEPVVALSVGERNALGFLAGQNGLAWGYGSYGTVSSASAAIGDGSYVPRDRPVVIMAANGAGSLDANDWYLDLDAASAETVPAASVPKALGISRLSGSDSGVTFDATIKYKVADNGKAVNNYVFGLVPLAFFDLVKSSPALSPPAKMRLKAAKNGGFVLAQLTPSGWTDVGGQLIAYSQGVASAVGNAVNILNGIPLAPIPGARFCIGYGESSGSMLTFESLREVLLLEGASANLSGVSCVLTGVYVEGPSGATVGASSTFTASVVGLSPTGTVQFRDGTTGLLSPVALSLQNQAVAKASLSTNALAVGLHAIGADYAGDGQNAAVSAEVPLRHEVVNAAPRTTTTAISGPASSDFGTLIALTATVVGNGPGGAVQFRDGAVNLGGPVPLVGGTATLRTAALAEGSHVVTAAYAGDGANDPSTSPGLAHTVYAAYTTQVTLVSSDTATTVGDAVTFTATVTGDSPTGSVTFRDGPTVLQAVALVNGSASITLTGLDGGLHIITADYGGDGRNQAVGSAAVFQQVSVPAGTVPANVSAMVTSYYRTILRRDPDAGGQAYWEGEAMRVRALGLNVNEVWFAMAQQFFTSAEYLAFGRDNTGFVTDLYTTFFNRAPDADGLGYWVGQLNQGMPREVALVSFMFSPEFVNYTQSIFGNTQVRREIDTVTDFYRGFLSRLPDDGGFTYWVGEFRKAQCAAVAQSSGAPVYAAVESISSAYMNSPEYGNRGRGNAQFIGDLYNAFLRRGGDLGGVLYWIGQVDSGARTREQVRQQFLGSPEFNARVLAVIAQGCLQ